MEITSHFLGITLDTELFVDLFTELQIYLNNNSISSCLEFVNPLSLHLTLYYFGDKFISSDYKKIKKNIFLLNKKFKNLSLSLDSYGVFQKNEVDCLYYLYPSFYVKFKKINDYYRKNFANSIIDNTQDFIPHITLFKILDQKNYLKHKEKIISVIDKHISIINNKNAFRSINLYCVNSKFSPQIQVILI